MSSITVNAASLIEHLSLLTDLRQPWKVDHKLTDILLLMICAVIAGAESWEEIEDFGNAREDWLKTLGEFEKGIPSQDTIARVVSSVNPKVFQNCFADWMKGCHTATEGAVVAIDGKVARSSYDKSRDRDPIHMVSAFCTANNVVLGQVKTDTKSNEITAIPELLNLLEIKGCLVTIDAMGCQRAIADKIVRKDADYLLAVKGNQPKLHAAFEEHFSMGNILSGSFDSVFETKEKNRGREEHRIHVVSDVFDEFVNFSFDWKGMKTLGAVIAFRQVGDTLQELENVTVRYYISSAELTAKQLATGARSHWAIENSLHYVLDVAMNEDACRIRRDDGAEVLAGFRHIALNLLKNEKTFKGGIKRKMKRAALSIEYMDTILTGVPLLSDIS